MNFTQLCLPSHRTIDATRISISAIALRNDLCRARHFNEPDLHFIFVGALIQCQLDAEEGSILEFDSLLMKFTGELQFSNGELAPLRTNFQISSLVPSGLAFDAVGDLSDSLILAVRSEPAEAECPLCSTASMRIHSRYVRLVADLPSAGREVHLPPIAYAAQVYESQRAEHFVHETDIP